MHPKKTYELRIAFSASCPEQAIQHKQAVMNWLIGMGEESFVEGAVDGLDIDFEYGLNDRDYYQEAGGDLAPLLIYRYDLEYLRDLTAKLIEVFADQINCTEHWLETEVWLEGWKASFRAFNTEQFLIFPPWEKAKHADTTLIPIEIEPGMAFGTGQHATTKLCLRELEKLPQFDRTQPILDVGTGTAILAIALAKLGYSKVLATDIDPDALVAAAENLRMNECRVELTKGSVPMQYEGQCSLVIANILMVVIKKLAPSLAASLAPGGYLLVSGVLDSESMEMRELGESLGLNFCHHQDQDGWVSLLFQKP